MSLLKSNQKPPVSGREPTKKNLIIISNAIPHAPTPYSHTRTHTQTLANVFEFGGTQSLAATTTTPSRILREPNFHKSYIISIIHRIGDNPHRSGGGHLYYIFVYTRSIM